MQHIMNLPPVTPVLSFEACVRFRSWTVEGLDSEMLLDRNERLFFTAEWLEWQGIGLLPIRPRCV